METRIVKAIAMTLEATDYVLVRTTLNELQREYALKMLSVATALRDLVITTPEGMIELAPAFFSFEVREQLNALIGYAELLLDESDGELSNRQREALHEARSASKQLLLYLTQLVE